MSVLVDSRQLRRFVVRIDGVDGRALGTGFFAAPGWVITCAHVVGDAPTVRVVPADRQVSAGDPEWQVVARSEAPGRPGALWPYPDLALLRAGGEVDHPCVRLEARDPAGDHDSHAWGYARREDGVAPPGSPASFGFEGVEGDGFLRLKAGQAAPGLSGAPLVCPSRRAVVGVVTATRDARSALGGWAAPVSALLAGGERVPEALAEAGAVIWSVNRAAAVRYRQAWNAVLPVDADGGLDQPWAPFVRGPRSTPAQLLRADFGVVSYLFRDAELAAAVAWCEDAGWGESRMAIERVAASGGAGKTRFAIELCQRVAGLGWVAGLWRGDAWVEDIPLPRLVVIDYAEGVDLADLQTALYRLQRHADGMAPVRVLLLTRTRAGRAQDSKDVLDELEASAPAALAGVMAASRDNPVASSALPLEQRVELFARAVAAFASAWNGDTGPGPREAGEVMVPDLGADRYGNALEVLFEALDHALGGGGRTGGARPPIERALGHEQKYWRITAPTPRPGDHLLRACVALATLAGAGDDVAADALLSVLEPVAGDAGAPERHRLAAWLASLYEGPGTLNPLRPDRLGEALVSGVLQDQADGGRALLAKVLSLASDEQVERSLTVLARLSAYDGAAAAATAAAVSLAHTALTARAEQQSHGDPGRPGQLALAGALQRLLTPGFCALIAQALADAEPGNTTYQRDLSVSYNKLADLAVRAGQGEVARQLYEQSLAIAQTLADAEPGNTTYQRDLSVSYNKLADLAVRAGQGEVARQLYEQSLAIAQTLADAEPGNTTYQRDLSVSYNKLADLAVRAGQGEVARQLYEQSLAIAQTLADAEPGNTTYQRDLSVSYNKLADLAVRAGQGEVARQLYEQSLAIAQTLADAEPGNTAYQRDLSVSYNKLADLAVRAGQGEVARQLYEQSLAIAQTLPSAWFRDRVEELDKVLQGVTSPAGPHFWLVIAPPQLGKSWFLDRIRADPALSGPDRWVIRLVDLRAESPELRRSARALLARFFDRPSAESGPEELVEIAQEIARNGLPHLCMLDSAELLDGRAAATLRSDLGQIYRLVQDSAREGVRLALIIASRQEAAWVGVAPAPRLATLALAEFTVDVVEQALRDLAQETERYFGPAELRRNAALAYRSSEGLPALLMRCLDWIQAQQWVGIERLASQHIVDSLAEAYIQDTLFAQRSLLPAVQEPADEALRALEEAFRVLVPHRLFTQLYLRHYLNEDLDLYTAVSGAHWSIEDLWEAIRDTSLLDRPSGEPWLNIQSAIRRLLYRYFYKSDAQRVAAHIEALSLIGTLAGGLSGRDQAVWLVESLWHETMVLSIRRPAAMEQDLSKSADLLSRALRESPAFNATDLRAYAAYRMTGDQELREALAKIDGLFDRLVEIVKGPSLSRNTDMDA